MSVSRHIAHIGQLHPHPDNIRDDLGDITELAASVRAHGFLGTNADNFADAAQKGRLNRGTANNMAKLNDDLVREIRRRHAAGESSSSIARDLGFGLNTVWRVAVRKGWTHVPDEPVGECWETVIRTDERTVQAALADPGALRSVS